MSINKISRRDFLKIAGMGLGALAFSPFIPGSSLDYGPPREWTSNPNRLIDVLSPESTRFLTDHNINTVVYKGKTVSIDDPTLNYAQITTHLDKVVGRLSGMEQNGKQSNSEGYNGEPMNTNYNLAYDKTTIMLDQTKKGELITQTFVGRRDGNGFGEPDGPLDLKRSLLVSKEGTEDMSAWFDNVKTTNIFENKVSEIVVDARQGAVFQITTDAKNPISAYFSDVKGEIAVDRLEGDLTTRTSRLKPVYLPSSIEFAKQYIDLLINTNFQTVPEAEKNTYVATFFQNMFSQDATLESRILMVKTLNNINGGTENFTNEERQAGISNKQKAMVEALSQSFTSSIPTNVDKMMKIVGAFRRIFENTGNLDAYITEAYRLNQTDPLSTFKTFIPEIAIPQPPDDTAARLTDVVNRLSAKEIRLPFAIPQLMIVSLKSMADGTKKQALVARYPADDMSTLNAPGINAISPGERLEYIGDVQGNAPSDVLGIGNGLFGNNMELSDRERMLSNDFKKTNIESIRNKNINQIGTGAPLMGYELDGETMYIANSEAVRLYYDPASTDSKLFAGMEFRSEKGDYLAFQLRPGRMTYMKFSARSFVDNRPNILYGLLGNENLPTAILDVTKKTMELRRQGYTTASSFGFSSPEEAAQLVLGLGDGKDYTALRTLMGEDATTSLVQDIQQTVIPHFSKAHSMAVSIDVSECTKYEFKQVEKKRWEFWKNEMQIIDRGSVSLDKNMIFQAFTIENIHGQDMAVVGKSKDDTIHYTVPVESLMFVDVESDTLLMVQNALAIAAVTFGGYKVFTNPAISSVLEDLAQGLMKIIIK